MSKAKPVDAASEAITTPPPASRETISIDAAVALGDIPILVREPMLEGAFDLERLVAGIDGKTNVATIALRAKIDVNQARAWFTELSQRGFVRLQREQRRTSDMEALAKAKEATRTPDWWLQGLKPRTGK